MHYSLNLLSPIIFMNAFYISLFSGTGEEALFERRGLAEVGMGGGTSLTLSLLCTERGLGEVALCCGEI